MAIAAAALSASAATKQFTLAFDENDFRFSTNEYGELVIQPADPMSTMPAGGLPALPQFSTVIAVGERQTYKSHEISVSKRLVRSGIVMEPAQFAVPTDSIFAGAKFERVFPDYDLAQYPADNCEYATTSHWAGGVSTLHFLSCPFVYNPEGGELYFIDSMTLTVELDETSAPARVAASSAVRHQTPWFVHDMVINPDDIPSGPQRISGLPQVGYVDPNRIDYVIITSEALKSAFEPLATWKKMKGVPSKIITIEEIEAKYTTGTQQFKIKNYLCDLYENNHLKYALLGGDSNIVPSQGCFGEVDEVSGYMKDENIPTDLFYACFGPSVNGTHKRDKKFEWNADCSTAIHRQLYGEITDSIDLAQSIYVTRVPVRTSQDVNAFVTRQLKYEKNPSTFNNNILMCGSEIYDSGIVLGERKQSDSEYTGDEIYALSMRCCWSGKRTRFYDTYSDLGENYEVNPEHLSEQLAKGYSFVNMDSHGDTCGWFRKDETALYSSDNAKHQTNTAETIITTSACDTNAFDLTDDKNCLSESFVKNPNSGIVGYLGSSRSGFSLPWGRGGSPSSMYSIYFYKHLFNNEEAEESEEFEESEPITKHFGELVAIAKAMNISKTKKTGSYRWVHFGLNPIGDPEMPIYTRKPMKYWVSPVKMHGDTLMVSTFNRSNVCLMSLNDNGKSYYRVLEDAYMVPFMIDKLPQICSIYTWKQNYIPRRMVVYNYSNISSVWVQNTTIVNDRIYKANTIRIGAEVGYNYTKGDVVFQKGETKILAKQHLFFSGVRIEKEAKLKLTCIE